jgi:hypothetical protein
VKKAVMAAVAVMMVIDGGAKASSECDDASPKVDVTG